MMLYVIEEGPASSPTLLIYHGKRVPSGRSGVVGRKRVMRQGIRPSVISAFAQTDDGSSELGSFIDAAFELGRKCERKIAKRNKKK